MRGLTLWTLSGLLAGGVFTAAAAWVPDTPPDTCARESVGLDGVIRNNTSWNTAFTGLYGSAPFSCGTCHDVIPGRNPYGADALAAPGASMADQLQAIEGDDSDGDTVSNVDEINAGTNPGVPEDAPPPTAAYIGSQACASCHFSRYTRWLTTLHSSIYREPVGENFLPTWSGVASVEDTGRGLGPIYVALSDSGNPVSGPFTATIYQDSGLTQMIAGPLEVARVHGGRAITENANNSPRNTPGTVRGLRSDNDNPILPGTPDHYPGEGLFIGKQRYQVMIGQQHYILPIQFNPIADFDRNRGGWVEYHLRDWIDTSFNLVLEATDSEERRCAGCHQTGIVDVTFDDAAVGTVPGSGNYEITGAHQLVGNAAVEENIGCEACHGPASLHAATLSPELIVNPADLDQQQRVDACGFCHSRGTSEGTVSGATLGYPYRDAAPNRPLPGDVWGDFYNEAGGYWIDEPGLVVASRHHQQYEEFVASQHFNNPFVEMDCGSCHEPHGSNSEHDLIMTARGVGSAGQSENLCYSCHQPFEFPSDTDTDRERHYWHPPQGTHGSPDCTNCHMPATATSAVAYDIHSHSFTLLGPEVTLDGIAMMDPTINACMVMCHTGPFGTSHSSPGPINPDRDAWDDPEDGQIAEFLHESEPGSTLVVNYLIASPETVELIVDHEYMAAALDPNRDTEATTGMDASPFVIDAADVVEFVNSGR